VSWGWGRPKERGPLKTNPAVSNGRVKLSAALSELWVFQEKVDMKVSAFSFNSSLLIFGYL